MKQANFHPATKSTLALHSAAKQPAAGTMADPDLGTCLFYHMIISTNHVIKYIHVTRLNWLDIIYKTSLKVRQCGQPQVENI